MFLTSDDRAALDNENCYRLFGELWPNFPEFKMHIPITQ